jgi:hypothetical protein
MSDHEYIQTIIRNIEETGRMIQGVYDPEGEEASFLYTVGNSHNKEVGYQNEYIAFSDSDFGGVFLNMVADYVDEEDIVLPTDEVTYLPGLLEGVICVQQAWMKEVEMGEQHCVAIRPLSGLLGTISRERYACAIGAPFFEDYVASGNNLFQVVLPDAQGRFPGESGCNRQIASEVPDFFHLPSREVIPVIK